MQIITHTATGLEDNALSRHMRSDRRISARLLLRAQLARNAGPGLENRLLQIPYMHDGANVTLRPVKIENVLFRRPYRLTKFLTVRPVIGAAGSFTSRLTAARLDTLLLPWRPQCHYR
jgi:hypothetical protein